MNLSAGSLGKITAVLVAGLSFVGLKLDPQLVGNGVQAAVALASTAVYILAEFKKSKETKEIKSDVAVNKALSEVAIEAATGVPSPIPVKK